MQFTQSGTSTVVTIDPGHTGHGQVLATLQHFSAAAMKAGADFYWH